MRQVVGFNLVLACVRVLELEDGAQKKDSFPTWSVQLNMKNG